MLRQSTIVLLFSSTVALSQSIDRPFLEPPSEDRPKTAIIQYESGRIVVVQLDVRRGVRKIEANGPPAAIAHMYLEDHSAAPTQAVPAQQTQPPPSGVTHEDLIREAMLANRAYGPGGYGYGNHDWINTNPENDASPQGRATERLKQRAAERRQEVKARRRELGISTTTNSSGRAYPSTAADQEQRDRLAEVTGPRAAGQSGRAAGSNSPYTTFYSLTNGLEAFRQQDISARKELTLQTFEVLLNEGLEFFHARQYGQAARSFVAAAMKDRGDPGSRLHAAQALMASGLHTEAMYHLRRAFELAPTLYNRAFNHRDNYGHAADFDAHLAALENYVGANPHDTDALVLLAYEQFFSDNPLSARSTMQRIRSMTIGDPFTLRLLRAAEPVVGRL